MSDTPPTKNNGPISQFKDEGPVKAVVWKNDGQNKAYNTTEFYRNISDGNGGFRQVTSIRDQDLPQLEELIKQVKENNRDLRKQYIQEALQKNRTNHEPDHDLER